MLQLLRPALQLSRCGPSLAVPTLIEREQIYGMYRLSDLSDGFSLDSIENRSFKTKNIQRAVGNSVSVMFVTSYEIFCKCFYQNLYTPRPKVSHGFPSLIRMGIGHWALGIEQGPPVHNEKEDAA